MFELNIFDFIHFIQIFFHYFILIDFYFYLYNFKNNLYEKYKNISKMLSNFRFYKLKTFQMFKHNFCLKNEQNEQNNKKLKQI